MRTKSYFRLAFPVFLLLIGVWGCKKDSSSPGKNEVLIEGMAFSPSTITVTANTTVTWTNKDAVAHTVTSDSGVFSSGNIATNGTYSFTFTTAGTFPYHCTIHPYMTAKVVVQQATSGSSSGSTSGY